MRNPWGAFAKDRDMFKIVVFASILIVVSILIISASVYWFSEKEVVKKLQDKDLVYIAQSISGQVDTRIERAEETSVALASDKAVEEWLAGAEQDSRLEDLLLQRLYDLAHDFDYNNSFIVSNITKQYWSETGDVIDVLDENDPDDSWFYSFMHSGERMAVDVDYNEERKDTFVFLNALVGSPDRPLGVAGVGLSLKTISEDFKEFKYGEKSQLWIVNEGGEIVMASDVEHNGKPLENYVPTEVRDQWQGYRYYHHAVLDYKTDDGAHKDLIIYPLKSAPLWLIFEIDRDETVSFLGTLRLNTFLVAAISVIIIVFLFFFVSLKIANPYKRALEQNKQLELEVHKRTLELMQRNEEITDSINYAKRIQQSLLPSVQSMQDALPEVAVHWRPRDIVGGDFYWIRQRADGRIWLAVGDCTGHGVPGAFMTMLAASLLNQLPELEFTDDPSVILSELNKRIKQMLKQNDPGGMSDDGLDFALCLIDDREIRFAGAGMSLYVRGADGAARIRGDRRSVGYRNTKADHPFQTSILAVKEASLIYLVTDGWVDQPGGAKGHSFGKSRFLRSIQEWGHLPLGEQVERMVRELEDYRGEEEQRDDITLVAVRTNDSA